jgi:hypothetical protein
MIERSKTKQPTAMSNEKLKLSSGELTAAVSRGLDSVYISHEGGTWAFDSLDPNRRCRVVFGGRLIRLFEKGEISADTLADHIAGYAIARNFTYNPDNPPIHEIDIGDVGDTQT